MFEANEDMRMKPADRLDRIPPYIFAEIDRKIDAAILIRGEEECPRSRNM